MSQIDQFDDYFECDNFVCSECIIDGYLIEVVEKNKANQSCSYCENSNATSMNDVLEEINQAIINYYGDAQYLGIPTNNSDFYIDCYSIEDVLEKFNPGWSDNLLEDLAYNLDQDICWIPHAKGNWGLMNPTEVMEYGWKNFVQTVKTKTRYFFDSEPIDEIEVGHPDYLPVSYVLSELERVVRKFNLIKVIERETSFYRVQASNIDEIFKFERLSVPPVEFATAGRMNPEGIPYFYVSSELKTAQIEALETKKQCHHFLHITNKLPLLVLDLSELPEMPSIFEHDKYDDLHELYFLEKFSNEISKPNIENKNIEYVPTQIVSEYFRHRFKHNGETIDGILFNSSKTDGTNFAFFYFDHKKVDSIFKKKSIKKINPK